ncbi:hypothetical protein GWK47_014301 [Chionoecetes opilio]|uniref:Uncharacterized protein n=1 Tax=Chionoecetes opilio TaxID=41210 RepID=A0A8J4XYC9_CHIOP|nr:hypothetical protein GWK47_014301 [Chionoecetes opilio]
MSGTRGFSLLHLLPLLTFGATGAVGSSRVLQPSHLGGLAPTRRSPPLAAATHICAHISSPHSLQIGAKLSIKAQPPRCTHTGCKKHQPGSHTGLTQRRSNQATETRSVRG